MVTTILAEGGDLKDGVVDFPRACLWPDDVKYSTRQGTYEHHFINVPDDAQTVDLIRDCSAVNCIAVGVQQSLNYLAREVDGKRDVTRRAAALRFLGHYIGDLHQPLHVGNASDWGGNKIKVRWFKKDSNLHAVWDYEMPDQMQLIHPDGIKLLRNVAHESTDGSVLNWLDESLALGRSHAYVNARGNPVESGDKLGADYLDRNRSVVIARMSLAGTRLARMLNQIADGEMPVAFVIQPAD